MDGARLANAAAAGFDLKDIPRLGVDVLVFGGAKAGAHCVEALVIFDKTLTRRIDNRLKQAGQTASKGRLLAAPMLGLLESGDWLTGAVHANLMAQRLADGIEGRTPFVLAHPVESNTVFVRMPDEAHQALNAAGWACYQFDDGSVRFVCSWATNEASVDELIAGDPDNAYFAELKGQIFFEEGRPVEAVAAHREAVRLDPTAPLLRINLAHALIGTDDPKNLDEAIEQLKHATVAERDNTMAWRLLGQAYAAQGKEGEARLATAEYYFAAGQEQQATQFALRARSMLDPTSMEWRRAVDIVLAS
ncbi:hypothetical protein LTR94_028326, partial [Friedmanniomyces endolithicus]